MLSIAIPLNVENPSDSDPPQSKKGGKNTNDVIRSSTDCLLAFIGPVEFRGEAEVANLELHVLNEQVPEFQVPVNDEHFMAVPDTADQLTNPEPALGFLNPSAQLEHIKDRLLAAQLHQKVRLIAVSEEPLELDDMLVFE